MGQWEIKIQFPDTQHATRNTQLIEVYPNPLQLERGKMQQFRAYGVDVSGNLIELRDVLWSITNGLGPN